MKMPTFICLNLFVFDRRFLSDLCFYMVNGAQVLNIDNYQTAFNGPPSALSIENDTYQQSQPDVSLRLGRLFTVSTTKIEISKSEYEIIVNYWLIGRRMIDFKRYNV